jgi:cell division septation protein DedD
MDQQLKQRLIGVTIIVALVVIFVPMLFEKSDDKGRFSSTGIPSIPDDVMEKSIELPKTAEDIAPNEEEKKPVESGYRIVPLNEDLPPKPKPVDGPVAKANPGKELGEEDEPVPPKEEDKPPAQAYPGKKTKIEMHPAAATARAAPPQAPDLHKPEPTVKHLASPSPAQAQKRTKPLRSTEPDADFDVREEPVPSPVRTESTRVKKPKSASVTPTKQGDDAAHKPVATQKTATAKLPVTLQPKPKASAPLPEADRNLDDEAIPAPAKAETPPAKPKPTISPQTRPKGFPGIAQERIKTPNGVKPPDVEHPSGKTDRPNSSPAEANVQQLKPKAIKPAPTPVKPAKPADPEKIKPQTTAPGG